MKILMIITGLIISLIFVLGITNEFVGNLTEKYWVKDVWTESEFQRDHNFCQNIALKPPYDGVTDVFEGCMKSRGWKIVKLRD